MEVVFLGNIGLDDSADTLVKIRQNFKQIFELFIYSSDQIGHLILLWVVMAGDLQAMLQELGHIDRIMVLMRSADSQTFRANHAFSLALRVDAHKGRRLFMKMTVVWLNEILEGFGEVVGFEHDE